MPSRLAAYGIDLDRLGSHRIGSSNYFNISAQAELEIQIVFRVAVVVVVVALTNTLANHASEDNATPQWPHFPLLCPGQCSPDAPWGRLCLPQFALPDSVSSAARSGLVASFMQQFAAFLRFCCWTISSTPFCRTLTSVWARGGVEREGGSLRCVCVWKMEIPISGDFCRLLGSAKSSRQRTEDKAMYRRNSEASQAAWHPRQRSIQASQLSDRLAYFHLQAMSSALSADIKNWIIFMIIAIFLLLSVAYKRKKQWGGQRDRERKREVYRERERDLNRFSPWNAVPVTVALIYRYVAWAIQCDSHTPQKQSVWLVTGNGQREKFEWLSIHQNKNNVANGNNT